MSIGPSEQHTSEYGYNPIGSDTGRNFFPKQKFSNATFSMVNLPVHLSKYN